MKLFNCFSAPGFHTSIITTFSIDFDAYESIALPRLREAGCNNNILIADARMLSQATEDGVRKPRFAGRRYSVIGASASASGVFHPKLIIQLGKSKGRLLVASANMTAAGLAGNLEVVGEVVTGEEDPQAAPLLRAAMTYVAQFLANTSVPRQQVDWAMKRTRWLYDSALAEPIIDIPGSGRIAFLSRNHPQGIGQQFVELVGDRVVQRLIAISPYWDFGLSALRELRNGVSAQRTSVLIQSKSALFPATALRSNDGVKLFDVNQVQGTVASRFAHAKVLIAESRDGDCILFGSANCTEAALGAANSPGVNEEACLYREVPSGQAVKMLGLQTALASAMELHVSDLPEFDPTNDIPLVALEKKLPGRFELSANLLRWWPTPSLSAEASTVQLFDQAGEPLASDLVKLGTQCSPAIFRLDGQVPPHFARVRCDGFQSSLAVVIVEQSIQETQRRFMTKGVANALDLLEDEAAFEGLWLLDVIQKLDDAERDSRALRGSGSESQSWSAQNNTEQESSQVLPYEKFVAGRRAEGAASGLSGSHLASTHTESVRTFLNALLGKRSGQIIARNENDDEELPELHLGDETADGEGALERDARFDTAAQGEKLDSPRDDEKLKQLLRRRQEYIKDTQRSIADAVEQFLLNIHGKASSRALGVVDLLRLRTLLLVVLGAGSKESDLLPKELNKTNYRRQILPSKGEFSWRRLVGRLLFDFFRGHAGSKEPLITRLALEVNGDSGMPEDVLETWATCFWAACAYRIAQDEKAQPFPLSTSEKQVAQDLYRYTHLLAEQALGEAINVIFDGMNSRYAERLGVSADRLSQEHRQLVFVANEQTVAVACTPPSL